MKFKYIFLIACIFPLWSLKLNLSYYEIFSIFLIFLIIPSILFFFILKKNYNNNIEVIIFSLFSVYCIDQNLGLWFSFDFINLFNSEYYNAIFFLFILIFLIYLLLFFLKFNGYKILFSFLLVIVLFNAIDQSKYLSSFPKKKIVNRDNLKVNSKNTKQLIIILDEMSGLNGETSNNLIGKNSDKFIKEFFVKNNFDIYTNVKSLFYRSDKAIPTIVNFIKSKDEYSLIDSAKEKQYIKWSDNYFITLDLTKNIFFNETKNKNLFVHQSMYLNFCDHPKVIKCDQFNSFEKNIYFINGFKDTTLTKIISAYKLNNSITSKLIWRLLRHLRIIDSVLEPEGEKAAFTFILDNLFRSIKNPYSDLIFAHILVPHIPYGYKKNCDYDGSKSIDNRSILIEEKINRHNIERVCVIKYLESFFNKLKRKDLFENLEIFIFSDHDSRINMETSDNRVLFVHKKAFSKNEKIINEKYILSDIFEKLVLK